jgi:2-hydroxychromene-2-carboxylate isomerase
VLWQAQRAGLPMALPAQHPFNPLPLLRLALACGPNRRVGEAVLRHVWRGGADAVDPHRLQALTAQLAPQRDPQSDAVKAELKQATADAAAMGVFGVPTFAHAGRLYWGVSALPMLAAALAGDAWFDSGEWDAAGAERPSVRR